MRNHLHLTLYDKKHAPDADRFQENYAIQNLLFSPPNPLTGLVEKKDRVCRFCKGKYPEVTFNKDAHIIPHLLGNEYLISDFECDSCNKIFSVYEAQLANYLGITRTLWKVKGKNGVPSFYSPGNVTYAKKEGFFNLKDAVVLSAPKYDFDLKTGICTIEYDKNPFRPLQVFKVFLKIALSLMPEEDLDNYSDLLTFILTNKWDNECKENPFFKIYRASVPYHYNPVAILFKKWNNDLVVPTHVLILFFGNKIYQLLIPNNKDDLKLYNEGFQACLMPPFHFDVTYDEAEGIKLIEEDMSEYDLKREKEIIRTQCDPQVLQNLSAYDLKTNTFVEKEFDPNSIVKMIIVEDGQVFKIPSKDI